jgi:hypothetical protein
MQKAPYKSVRIDEKQIGNRAIISELKINLKYLKKHLHFRKRCGIIVSAQ